MASDVDTLLWDFLQQIRYAFKVEPHDLHWRERFLESLKKLGVSAHRLAETLKVPLHELQLVLACSAQYGLDQLANCKYVGMWIGFEDAQPRCYVDGSLSVTWMGGHYGTPILRIYGDAATIDRDGEKMLLQFVDEGLYLELRKNGKKVDCWQRKNSADFNAWLEKKAVLTNLLDWVSDAQTSAVHILDLKPGEVSARFEVVNHVHRPKMYQVDADGLKQFCRHADPMAGIRCRFKSSAMADATLAKLVISEDMGIFNVTTRGGHFLEGDLAMVASITPHARPQNLQGCLVRIIGLRDRVEFNGLQALCLHKIAESNRWGLKLAQDDTTISVKRENFELAACLHSSSCDVPAVSICMKSQGCDPHGLNFDLASCDADTQDALECFGAICACARMDELGAWFADASVGVPCSLYARVDALPVFASYSLSEDLAQLFIRVQWNFSDGHAFKEKLNGLFTKRDLEMLNPEPMAEAIAEDLESMHLLHYAVEVLQVAELLSVSELMQMRVEIIFTFPISKLQEVKHIGEAKLLLCPLPFVLEETDPAQAETFSLGMAMLMNMQSHLNSLASKGVALMARTHVLLDCYVHGFLNCQPQREDLGSVEEADCCDMGVASKSCREDNNAFDSQAAKVAPDGPTGSQPTHRQDACMEKLAFGKMCRSIFMSVGLPNSYEDFAVGDPEQDIFEVLCASRQSSSRIRQLTKDCIVFPNPAGQPLEFQCWDHARSRMSFCFNNLAFDMVGYELFPVIESEGSIDVLKIRYSTQFDQCGFSEGKVRREFAWIVHERLNDLIQQYMANCLDDAILWKMSSKLCRVVFIQPGSVQVILICASGFLSCIVLPALLMRSPLGRRIAPYSSPAGAFGSIASVGVNLEFPGAAVIFSLTAFAASVSTSFYLWWRGRGVVSQGVDAPQPDTRGIGLTGASGSTSGLQEASGSSTRSQEAMGFSVDEMLRCKHPELAARFETQGPCPTEQRSVLQRHVHLTINSTLGIDYSQRSTDGYLIDGSQSHLTASTCVSPEHQASERRFIQNELAEDMLRDEVCAHVDLVHLAQRIRSDVDPCIKSMQERNEVFRPSDRRFISKGNSSKRWWPRPLLLTVASTLEVFCDSAYPIQANAGESLQTDLRKYIESDKIFQRMAQHDPKYEATEQAAIRALQALEFLLGLPRNRPSLEERLRQRAKSAVREGCSAFFNLHEVR